MHGYTDVVYRQIDAGMRKHGCTNVHNHSLAHTFANVCTYTLTSTHKYTIVNG